MKQFLSNVTGFENHLIFSMVVFFSFFILMGIWLVKLDKKKMNELKNIPFNNDKK